MDLEMNSVTKRAKDRAKLDPDSIKETLFGQRAVDISGITLTNVEIKFFNVFLLQIQQQEPIETVDKVAVNGKNVLMSALCKVCPGIKFSSNKGLQVRGTEKTEVMKHGNYSATFGACTIEFHLLLIRKNIGGMANGLYMYGVTATLFDGTPLPTYLVMPIRAANDAASVGTASTDAASTSSCSTAAVPACGIRQGGSLQLNSAGEASVHSGPSLDQLSESTGFFSDQPSPQHREAMAFWDYSPEEAPELPMNPQYHVLSTPIEIPTHPPGAASTMFLGSYGSQSYTTLASTLTTIGSPSGTSIQPSSLQGEWNGAPEGLSVAPSVPLNYPEGEPPSPAQGVAARGLLAEAMHWVTAERGLHPPPQSSHPSGAQKVGGMAIPESAPRPVTAPTKGPIKHNAVRGRDGGGKAKGVVSATTASATVTPEAALNKVPAADRPHEVRTVFRAKKAGPSPSQDPQQRLPPSAASAIFAEETTTTRNEPRTGKDDPVPAPSTATNPHIPANCSLLQKGPKRGRPNGLDKLKAPQASANRNKKSKSAASVDPAPVPRTLETVPFPDHSALEPPELLPMDAESDDSSRDGLSDCVLDDTADWEHLVREEPPILDACCLYLPDYDYGRDDPDHPLAGYDWEAFDVCPFCITFTVGLCGCVLDRDFQSGQGPREGEPWHGSSDAAVRSGSEDNARRGHAASSPNTHCGEASSPSTSSIALNGHTLAMVDQWSWCSYSHDLRAPAANRTARWSGRLGDSGDHEDVLQDFSHLSVGFGIGADAEGVVSVAPTTLYPSGPVRMEKFTFMDEPAEVVSEEVEFLPRSSSRRNGRARVADDASPTSAEPDDESAAQTVRRLRGALVVQKWNTWSTYDYESSTEPATPAVEDVVVPCEWAAYQPGYYVYVGPNPYRNSYRSRYRIAFSKPKEKFVSNTYLASTHASVLEEGSVVTAAASTWALEHSGTGSVSDIAEVGTDGAAPHRRLEVGGECTFELDGTVVTVTAAPWTEGSVEGDADTVPFDPSYQDPLPVDDEFYALAAEVYSAYLTGDAEVYAAALSAFEEYQRRVKPEVQQAVPAKTVEIAVAASTEAHTQSDVHVEEYYDCEGRFSDLTESSNERTRAKSDASDGSEIVGAESEPAPSTDGLTEVVKPEKSRERDQQSVNTGTTASTYTESTDPSRITIITTDVPAGRSLDLPMSDNERERAKSDESDDSDLTFSDSEHPADCSAPKESSTANWTAGAAPWENSSHPTEAGPPLPSRANTRSSASAAGRAAPHRATRPAPPQSRPSPPPGPAQLGAQPGTQTQPLLDAVRRAGRFVHETFRRPFRQRTPLGTPRPKK